MHNDEEACQSQCQLETAGSHVHQAGNLFHGVADSHDQREESLSEESSMQNTHDHVAEVHSPCLDNLDYDTMDNHVQSHNLALVSLIDSQNHIA